MIIGGGQVVILSFCSPHIRMEYKFPRHNIRVPFRPTNLFLEHLCLRFITLVLHSTYRAWDIHFRPLPTLSIALFILLLTIVTPILRIFRVWLNRIFGLIQHRPLCPRSRNVFIFIQN